MKKKLLSIILALSMLAGMIPLGTMTAFAGTTGIKGATIDYGNATFTSATNGDLILSYKAVGTDTLTIPEGCKAVADFLVVGGGGSGSSGGSSTNKPGFGGEGGAVVTQENVILAPGAYTVTVGDGGGGVKSTSASSRKTGLPGSSSSVTGADGVSITVVGGAGGGNSAVSGKGTASEITGTLVTYGVDGESRTSNAAVVAGDANTGNGGSGGYSKTTSGAGGSGVVVIRITDLVPFHHHSFTYHADGNKITATCAEGCVCGYDKTPLQFTLTEYGLFDADELEMWKFQEAEELLLTCYAASDLVHPLSDEPTTAGSYVVMASAGGVSAQQTFTITDHAHVVDGVRAEFKPWTNSTTLPTGGNWYLTQNVTLGANIAVTGVVNLCMNGYVIFKNGYTVTGMEPNFFEQDPSAYVNGYISDTEIWYHFDNSDGTLTIGGEGSIPQKAFDEYPWYDNNFAANIKKLVIDEGITNLPDFNGKTFNYMRDITIKSKHFNLDFDRAMYNQTGLKTLTFAEGVESISITGGNTFSNCTALTTVNLPSTLKSLSVHSTTFTNDTAFTTITLAEGNEHFLLAGGALYNKEQTELILSPTATTVTPVSTTQKIKAGLNVDIASMLKSTASDTNIQITLKRNQTGKTVNNDQFYVGEMIKAEVTAKEGELPDGLFYAWLGYANGNRSAIDNAKTATIAGFETSDTLIDGNEYSVSPDALYGAVKITCLPYDSSKKGYYGTAYCRFAVCRVVDGVTKIVAYKNFTVYAKSSGYDYTYDHFLSQIANNTVTMIKGETHSVQELLGRCGVTHVTCSAITISDLRLGMDDKHMFSISGNNITAVDCVADYPVYFYIEADNCLYHGTTTPQRGELMVNVIEDPQIEAKCTSVVVNNPADGYDYFIGQQKGEVIDGKVYFSGLTPDTEYIVRMQITAENGAATYTAASKIITEHDFTVLTDNGDGTHSTYCKYGCGECIDTEEHDYVNNVCICGATLTPSHDHDFTGAYVQGTGDNANKHARKCTGEDCEAVGLDGVADAYEACSGGEATCSAKAVCSVCEAEYGDKLAHSFTTYTSDNNATCLADGTKTAKCDYCTATDTVTETGTKKDHSYTGEYKFNADTKKHSQKCVKGCGEYGTETACTFDNGSITTEPTCTEKGVKTFTCSLCEGTYTEDVDAKGHSMTKTEAKAATCLAAGNNEYYTCSVCTKVYKDANGGTETTVAAETLTQLSHSYTGEYKFNAETKKHSRKCVNGCNEYGTETGCSFDDGVVTTDPTCTEKGVKTFTCSACKGTYTKDVDANGHKWINAEKDKDENTTLKTPATCTADAVYYKVCDVCKVSSKGIDEAEIWTDTGTATGDTHKWVTPEDAEDIAKAEVKTPATCEADAVCYKICSVCKTSSKGVAEDETWTNTGTKLSHSYTGEYKYNAQTKKHSQKCVNGCGEYGTETDCSFDGVVTTDPTCTEKGIKTYTCSVCKGTYTEDVDANGHSMTKTEAKAATCLAAGNNEYYTCSVCTKVYKDANGVTATTVEAETTAKKDHSYTGECKDDENGITHTFKCVNGCNAYGAPEEHVGMEDFVCDKCGYTDIPAQLKKAKEEAIDEINRALPENASEEVVKAATEAIERIIHAENLTAVNEIKTAAIDEIAGGSGVASFKCPLCPRYEEEKDIPFYGFILSIVHLFVHMVYSIGRIT